MKEIEFFDNTDEMEDEEFLEQIIQFDNYQDREQKMQLLSEGRGDYD